MKKKLLYFLGLLVLIALVAGGLKLRHQRQQELAGAPAPVPAPWAVHSVPVVRGRATWGFPALALVKGASESAISAQLSGILLEVARREGERVLQGDLLARIDTRELEDQLASLQAQRDAAEADSERLARDAQRSAELFQKRGISESELDRQRAAADAAREKVNSLKQDIAAARTRLGYATIRAPFAGVIAERLADPGDLAVPGKTLYRLIGTDGIRLEVRLPSEVLARVRPGTEVVIEHENQTLSLKADRIFPSLDERSLGRLEIDVTALPFGAAPGALLRARVITDAVDHALLVPADSLLPSRDPVHTRVLRLSNDQPPRIQSVPVTIRLRAAEGVAVEGALEPGDRLVSAHETTLLRLSNGDRVQIEGEAP